MRNKRVETMQELPAPEIPAIGDAKQESLVTLNRGLAILEALAGASSSRGLDHFSLARRLHFRRSTLYRYLACLERSGFVECADDRGRFRLGPAIVRLAAMVHSREFSEFAPVSARGLAALTGETVYAMVYDYPYTIAVHAEDGGSGSVRPPVALGSRQPLHATTSGRVFLAHERPHVVNKYLAGPLLQRSPRTIVNPVALRRIFDDVRKDGYVVDQGESWNGICGIAAPVFNAVGNVVGTLSVVVAAPQLGAARLKALSKPLMAAATELSLRLGYVERSEPESGTEDTS